MGIAISYSPERVDDAHAHGADPRQEAAGSANKEREPKAKCQNRLGKDKGGQQTGESQADNRDGQVGESQANEAAYKGDDDGLRQYEEKTSPPGEADGFKDGQFGGALRDRDSHRVAGDEQKCKENDAADGYLCPGAHLGTGRP